MEKKKFKIEEFFFLSIVIFGFVFKEGVSLFFWGMFYYEFEYIVVIRWDIEKGIFDFVY